MCELLELDPFAFTVACIPFDAYVRLAPRLGWGQQTMWTHLDGYRVARALEPRAMVGGDVRYGGCHDLCMVGRHYDSAQLTARFVIARCRRLGVARGGADVARDTAHRMMAIGRHSPRNEHSFLRVLLPTGHETDAVM